MKQGINRSEALRLAWAQTKAPPQQALTEEEILTARVRQYRELKARTEALETQMNEVKASIIETMEARKIDEMVVDVYKVRYLTVISNKFDTKTFKTAHKDLYSEFLKESTCKRFTVV